MKHIVYPKRFQLLLSFVLLFLSVSFLVRLSFLLWSFSETDHSVMGVLRIFATGLFFDVGTVSFFVTPYIIYLFFFPERWVGSLLDRILTYTIFSAVVLIVYFSFFAEFTFWDEFYRRFNFIAVDYLIYTYEVVKNINESYPLPMLISAMLLMVLFTVFLFKKFKYFKHTFTKGTSIREKAIYGTPWLLVVIFFAAFISNENADWSSNRYNNELSKAGIYSFFAAFRNNELSYTDFYRTLPEKNAYEMVRNHLSASDQFIKPSENPVYRNINKPNPDAEEIKPNVIFICIESLSAKYLGIFGNENQLTPSIDKLAGESILFNNLYATGTRTVRGMEAITLSIPPTPGRSIVKRENNKGMYTIGEVFKAKGYKRTFFYGGDGYFDNMNAFFSGNGFDIVDRGRGFLMGDRIATSRTNIDDDEVTFENAWGVCDEDIFNKVLKEADLQTQKGVPFFNFVMTTSNHKPYTYPEGKIDIPSGTSRNGAIKYTDYAIGKFIEAARQKPWFSNTVFVIMSDHCASSAGRWELDVNNYHIPALIYNLPNQQAVKIDRQCSQIDMFPTLFGYLNWEYRSNFFGQDINRLTAGDERAFIGNYRKLGLLRGNNVMILGDQKTANFYAWDIESNKLEKRDAVPAFLDQTISFYQVADELYSKGKLELKNLNL